MTNISRSIDIPATPETAFAFVSDIANLPRFVPTTRSAQDIGHGKVHVEGEYDGHAYANDGHLYVDAERRLMRWGSGETGYRGELTVEQAGAGSRVAIALHFHDGGHTSPLNEIDRGLATSLDRLRIALA